MYYLLYLAIFILLIVIIVWWVFFASKPPPTPPAPTLPQVPEEFLALPNSLWFSDDTVELNRKLGSSRYHYTIINRLGHVVYDNRDIHHTNGRNGINTRGEVQMAWGSGYGAIVTDTHRYWATRVSQNYDIRIVRIEALRALDEMAK